MFPFFRVNLPFFQPLVLLCYESFHESFQPELFQFVILDNKFHDLYTLCDNFVKRGLFT